jgi:hypothetical protein
MWGVFLTMINGIPKGTGNSRAIRADIAEDITLAELVEMMRTGQLFVDISGPIAENWDPVGTPLNKDTLLSDSTVATIEAFGAFTGEPTPDKAFAKFAAAGSGMYEKIGDIANKTGATMQYDFSGINWTTYKEIYLDLEFTDTAYVSDVYFRINASSTNVYAYSYIKAGAAGASGSTNAIIPPSGTVSVNANQYGRAVFRIWKVYGGFMIAFEIAPAYSGVPPISGITYYTGSTTLSTLDVVNSSGANGATRNAELWGMKK